MRFPLVSFLLLVLLTGCVSKSAARRQAEDSFNAGEQKVLMDQEPAVWFRGDVRHQRIPWTEGLTLAQAIVAAQYTWSWDPRFITITRAGEVYSVNPRRLLRGQENPLLEAGDIVEVRH